MRSNGVTIFIVALACIISSPGHSWSLGPIAPNIPIPDPLEAARKAAEAAARAAQQAAEAAAQAARDSAAAAAKAAQEAADAAARQARQAAEAAAKAAQDVADAQIRAAQAAAAAAEKAAAEVAKAADESARVAANAVVKAAEGTAATAAQTAQDAAQTAVKGTQDVAAAVVNANRDAERTAVWVVVNANENAKKALADANAAVEKARNDVTVNAQKAASDAVRTTDKALQDTLATVNKAADDAGRNIDKGVRDTIDAAKVVAKFNEKQLRGTVSSLDEAAKRAREGKIVDAVWQVSVAPVQHTDANAAEAAQESAIINTIGQVAATAYGGPGGAAAYAAWYTYHQTGNVEMAIRVGLITGAASAAFSAVGTMPKDQVAQKAILAGTIGAVAVAAAGGDEEAMKQGFLMSGGMVLVQYTYEEVTTHPLNDDALKASQGDAYCMATLNAECSPPASAVDENGKVDVRRTDPHRPHVGKWSTADGKPGFIGERSEPMVAVSRVPGMNAMAVFHDQWAVSWDFDNLPMGDVVTVGTIPIAVVFTYIGSGSPYYIGLQEAAVRNGSGTKVEAPPPVSPK